MDARQDIRSSRDFMVKKWSIVVLSAVQSLASLSLLFVPIFVFDVSILKNDNVDSELTELC